MTRPVRGQERSLGPQSEAKLPDPSSLATQTEYITKAGLQPKLRPGGFASSHADFHHKRSPNQRTSLATNSQRHLVVHEPARMDSAQYPSRTEVTLGHNSQMSQQPLTTMPIGSHQDDKSNMTVHLDQPRVTPVAREQRISMEESLHHEPGALVPPEVVTSAGQVQQSSDEQILKLEEAKAAHPLQ